MVCAMRRLIVCSSALLAAACARTPSVQTPSTPVPTVPRETGELIGLTSSAMVQRFGTPRLQIKEGASTKRQWVANGCVLDAYFYPQSGGEKVAHVDARRPSGRTFSD